MPGRQNVRCVVVVCERADLARSRTFLLHDRPLRPALGDVLNPRPVRRQRGRDVLRSPDIPQHNLLHIHFELLLSLICFYVSHFAEAKSGSNADGCTGVRVGLHGSSE